MVYSSHGEKQEMSIQFCWENLNGDSQMKNLSMYGRVILKINYGKNEHGGTLFCTYHTDSKP
jgi:hypothetical protein